jgi:hypothetical protein
MSGKGPESPTFFKLRGQFNVARVIQSYDG